MTLKMTNSHDSKVLAAKGTIKIGTDYETCKVIEVQPITLQPGQLVTKEFVVDISGCRIQKPAMSSGYLRIFQEFWARWGTATENIEGWVAAGKTVLSPNILVNSEVVSAKGGVMEKTEEGLKVVEIQPKATDSGIVEPEIKVLKPEGDDDVQYHVDYERGTVSGYLPTETEVVKPNGETIKTTAVIEPPIAEEHPTDPGTISLIPKKPSEPASPLEWLWKILVDFWNWLLSLLGLR